MEWSPLKCESSSSSSSWLHNLRCCADGGYALHLTDGARVFSERLAAEQVEVRCEDLNPAVEASAEDLVEEITGLLASKTSHVQLKELKTGSNLRLEAAGKLFGYDFRWRFDLEALSAEAAYDALFSNVFKCVSHLLEQQRHLLQVIKAKDLEIFDYEQSGATLTRRTLKTDKFDAARDLHNKVPYTPRDDAEVMSSTLSSEEFRRVQRSVEAGAGRKRALAATPEEERAKARARAKRIRIKGAAAQLFQEEESQQESEKTPTKKGDGGGGSRQGLSESAKKNKALAKKLKKL